MKGYEVETFDGHKIGHVVDVEDEFIVFEHGHLHKTKQALPNVSAQVDDAEQIVHTNLSKSLIYDSPKVDGKLDRQLIAEHYGIEDAVTDPPTRAQAANGNDDGVQQRVAVREAMTTGHGSLDEPPTSGLAGGPRKDDYPKD
jgi:hypothetical protein